MVVLLLENHTGECRLYCRGYFPSDLTSANKPFQKHRKQGHCLQPDYATIHYSYNFEC